jgi:hypothetical protein
MYDNHGENGMKEKNGRNEEMFFVVQPNIHLETNLLKYGKVFVGANYRLAIDKKT